MVDFREVANLQAQLIWNRYNAMIVAHAILIGLLGQAAISKDKPDNIIVIFGAIVGFVLAMIWWRLTSVGWSLMHEWLNEGHQTADAIRSGDAYEKWTKKFLFPNFQDSIWWCAHGVILVFISGYLLLFFYYARAEKIDAWLLGIFAIIATIWCIFTIISSLFTHNIRNKRRSSAPTQDAKTDNPN